MISWFYIIGEHWFKVYVGIVLILLIIYRVNRIVIAYQGKIKELKEKSVKIINKIEILKDLIILYGFSFQTQFLYYQVFEIQWKTILLGGATINIKRNRIDWKYSQYLMPLSLGTSKKYNTKTKRYCVAHSDHWDYETRYKNSHRNRSLIRKRYITKGMEKLIKKKRI